MSSKGEVDLSKMLSLIPPASAIYSKQSKAIERRVKLVYDENLKEGELRLSKKLATSLGITGEAEVAVSGKIRLRLKAVIDENIDDEVTVWANPGEMESVGIANNSMVTLRAPR